MGLRRCGSGLAVCLGLSSPAWGCTGSVPFSCTTSFAASIGFDSPLTIAKVADVQFGTVAAGRSATYSISTTGSVTTTGSGQWLLGTTSAGNVRVSGSASQLVNISVTGYTSNRGVTPANATCAYDGGSAGPCAITGAAAPTGSGKTLLVGMDVVVDGTQAAGAVATPSVIVIVVYQ